MKTLGLILIYIGSFMLVFFLLSLIGLLWVSSYKEVITDPTWFVYYFMFIGWWIAIPPTLEYYNRFKDELDKVFTQ